jgi:Na+/proline symporter
VNLHWIDIAIICLYVVGVIVAGVILSRKASENIGSYFLGGNKIPWFLLAVSNGSSMFDVTGTMFGVYVLFTYGFKSLWFLFLWPAFNQIFMMVYLSKWIRRSNVLTGSEWIKTRFGKGTGAELCSISIVVFAISSAICLIALAFVGVGKFASVFLPWDIPPQVYAFVFVGATTIYVIFGGMYSVVLTDIVQYVMMTIVSVTIGIIAINKVDPQIVSSVVPAGWKNVFFGAKLNLDWSASLPALNEKIASDGFIIFAYVILMSLWQGVFKSMAGPGPNYDMQRILATRSPKDSALMSGSSSLVVMLPRYFLMAAIAALAFGYFIPELQEMGTDVDFEQIMPMVIGRFLPIGLVGVMLAGLLAAFMSTFDSTVNSAAAYLVNDIYKKYIHKNAPQARYVIIGYASSIIIVGLGIFFGIYSNSILEIMLWLVAGLYAGFAPPNVIRWHWWRFNGYGYFGGMISGIAMAAAYPKLFPEMSAIDAFPFIFFGSSAISIIVSLLTKPTDEWVLKEFYRTVRPWGFWGPIKDKVEAENPDFKTGNRADLDLVSCAVGIVWQVSIAAMPVYAAFRMWKGFFVAVGVFLFCSTILKFTWYDRLGKIVD